MSVRSECFLIIMFSSENSVAVTCLFEVIDAEDEVHGTWVYCTTKWMKKVVVVHWIPTLNI